MMFKTDLALADARNRSNAVISHKTNEFGYATLTEIYNNAIFQYRDIPSVDGTVFIIARKLLLDA